MKIKLIALYFITSFILGCNTTTTYESVMDFGKFSGNVKVEWLTDRKMRLLERLEYTDPDNLVWVAPKGSVIDGASIPKQLWTIIGSPFVGKYRDASVIHDIACDQKKYPWADVHEAFYNAMRASGVAVAKAKIMYGAVYHFGPRWSSDGREFSNEPRSPEAFQNIVDEIKRREESGQAMTPDEIRKYYAL
jgi:hypothetical protein